MRTMCNHQDMVRSWNVLARSHIYNQSVFLQASPGGLEGSVGLGIQAHGQKDHGAIEVMIK